MKEIKAIVKRVMLDKVIDSLQELPHLPDISMSMVYGFTRNDPGGEPPDLTGEAKMAKLEVVVPDVLAEEVVETIRHGARRGREDLRLRGRGRGQDPHGRTRGNGGVVHRSERDGGRRRL